MDAHESNRWAWTVITSFEREPIEEVMVRSPSWADLEAAMELLDRDPQAFVGLMGEPQKYNSLEPPRPPITIMKPTTNLRRRLVIYSNSPNARDARALANPSPQYDDPEEVEIWLGFERRLVPYDASVPPAAAVSALRHIFEIGDRDLAQRWVEDPCNSGGRPSIP